MKKLTLLFTLSLLCFILPFISYSQRSVSAKRGVGYGYNSSQDLSALSAGISWWYNWSLKPDAGVVNTYKSMGVDFVPMVWGGVPDANQIAAAIPDGTKYLLGFNEPNFGGQSNITAQRAAELWPVFEEVAARKNLKLVSPAVNYCGGNCNQTDPVKYLDDFFAACPNCKVDYIAIHWYACSGSALSWYINQFKKYGKPIWVTEFSCGDQADLSLAVQKKYMQEAVAILENDPAVFRYAWFAGRTNGIANVNLLGASGQLTELGQLYVSLPFQTNNTNGISIPGKIEAETYTQMQGIDLQATSDAGGGSNVAWIDNGDWTEYKIDVTTASIYDFTYRIASTSGMGKIHAEIDGQLIPASGVTIPNTGAWQSWSSVKVSGISLTAGAHTLRLVYDIGGFNINYLTILPSGTATQNIALNKPIYSSSDQSSGSTAKLANDGKTNTRWSSSFSDPQWIYIDLQDTYALQKVKLYWEAASAKSYKIQVSDNASQWNDLFFTTTGDGGIDSVNVNGSGRYIRVSGTQRNTAYGYSLWEIEVYGSKASGNRFNNASEETITTAADVLIYPNPFNEAAFISSSEIEQIQSISIFNSAGMLVEFHNDKNFFKNNMPVAQTLPIGIYLFKIVIENDVRTFRIIKN